MSGEAQYGVLAPPATTPPPHGHSLYCIPWRSVLSCVWSQVATAATKLDCVQIDGLVVLKIIKHCR